MVFIFSAARLLIIGITCEYVLSVNVMDEWPSRSLTTFGFSSAKSSNVAHVCRKSYSRR
jgi:hypothetical protein